MDRGSGPTATFHWLPGIRSWRRCWPPIEWPFRSSCTTSGARIDIRSPWMWAKVGLLLAVLGGSQRWPGGGGASQSCCPDGVCEISDGSGAETSDGGNGSDARSGALRHPGFPEVVRTYLEERFGSYAPDRTTEEFLGELPHQCCAGVAPRFCSRTFSRDATWEFARAEPGPEELAQLHASAFRLVDETAPVAVPPVPPRTEREGDAMNFTFGQPGGFCFGADPLLAWSGDGAVRRAPSLYPVFAGEGDHRISPQPRRSDSRQPPLGRPRVSDRRHGRP